MVGPWKKIRVERPVSGVMTDDGDYFHHMSDDRLDEEDIKRLLDCGIQYTTRPFTPQEDAIIRKNWAKYAKKNDLKYSEAPFYIGIGERKEGSISARSRREFLESTRFFPSMCKNLPHRSACSVKFRMRHIFDPAFAESSEDISYCKKRRLTENEFKKFLEHYSETGDISKAAKAIQKPFKQCYNALATYTEPLPDITKMEYPVMWRLLNTCIAVWEGVDIGPPGNTKSIKRRRKVIPEFIRACVIHNNEEKVDKIVFKRISCRMKVSEISIEPAWKEIVSKLRHVYNEHISNETTEDEAWELSTIKICPKAITTPQLITFLSILEKNLKELDPDNEVSSFGRKHFGLESIQKAAQEKGVKNFYSGAQEGHMYLLRRVEKMAIIMSRKVLKLIKRQYSLQERIRILRVAFERTLESDVQHNPNLFPRLETIYLIESIIVVTMELDPNWIPPTKFKKYVDSLKLLKLFGEEKDNSSLWTMAELAKRDAFVNPLVDSEDDDEAGNQSDDEADEQFDDKEDPDEQSDEDEHEPKPSHSNDHIQSPPRKKSKRT